MSDRAPGLRTGLGLRTALLAAFLLAIAAPPGRVPFGGLLVVPGLAAWCAIARTGRRPVLHSYLLGALYMAWFSWSLRHVMWEAYFAVVAVGGLYFALGASITRAVPRALGPLGFGLAVATTAWLRANLPEIHYPHGQPCHALWTWPALLGSLTLGGEPLANGLLGAFAAALADLWHSWRLGEPAWRATSRWAVVVAVLGVALTVGGHFARGAVPAAPPGELTVACIEPGLHCMDPYLEAPPAERGALALRLLRERLLAPTKEVLANDAPDLVLWPESSVRAALPADDLTNYLPGPLRDLAAPTGRLLFGADVERDDHLTPAALLLDLGTRRLVGHQEKRCLVPGGEFLPFLAWLPAGVQASVREAFTAALGFVPDCLPGRELPPLQTASGVPFGALLCYDNAFPGPGAAQVAAGARVLCVISNESWYRGGDELSQLAAMSVCRALELGTPLVRCTTDGWSLVVGGDGHILASLPLAPAPQPSPRILLARVPLGPGRVPPMAWLRGASGAAAGLLAGLALLHRLLVWARLRVARTAPGASATGGGPPAAARSGS